jgi:ABC-type transporter Mla subunit MlaD
MFSRHRLREELRWIDEEQIRCRAEDEARAAARSREMEERAAQGATKLEQLSQKIEPLVGADTLSATASRVAGLGEKVAALAEHLEAMQVKEVASAAERRLKEAMAQVQAQLDGTRGSQGDVLRRLQHIENLVQQEQRASLATLEKLIQSPSMGRSASRS